MKKSILTAFILGFIFAMNPIKAQDCSQGDASARGTFSLYKEYFKQGAIERALPYWREVRENAPGLTKSIFIDGADMYIHLIDKAEDEAQKQLYIDTLMGIYDQRIQCWGDKGYVLQLKGMDLARYRPQAYPQAMEYLKEAIDLDQANSKYYGVHTYFNILINLLDEVEGVDADFIKKEYDQLVAICDANISKGTLVNEFSEVKKAMAYNLKEYVLPNRFEADQPWHTWTTEEKIDSVAKWIEEDSSTTNMDDILTHLKRDKNLRDSEIRNTIETKLFERSPTADAANNIGVYFYGVEQHDQAISYFTKAIELTEEDNSSSRANLLLAIADTYRKMNEFEEARESARAAIALDSASAKPYYLIGVLYLSSGSKCGSGTGFNSQRVLWPAFDYFNKAKELDESYAEVVDPLMKDYKQYLPTRAEVAAKGLRVGGTYTVPCWINEETTVITKD